MRALLQTARANDAARGVRSGQVQAVGRAIAILSAFDGREVFLPLAELARRTGMHKPTVLRLARTLAVSRFLVPREDGAWRLGPAAGWLGSRYQAQFDVDSAIEPILKKLCAETGESAAFYVHEGNLRSCLMRCDGPAALPDHVRSGEVLPVSGKPSPFVAEPSMLQRERKDGVPTWLWTVMYGAVIVAWMALLVLYGWCYVNDGRKGTSA